MEYYHIGHTKHLKQKIERLKELVFALCHDFNLTLQLDFRLIQTFINLLTHLFSGLQVTYWYMRRSTQCTESLITQLRIPELHLQNVNTN